MSRFVVPLVTGLAMLVTWWGLYVAGAFPVGTVPHPWDVAVAFRDELTSGRLVADTIASPVEAVYQLSEGREAVLHAARGARSGKILLTTSADLVSR